MQRQAHAPAPRRRASCTEKAASSSYAAPSRAMVNARGRGEGRVRARSAARGVECEDGSATRATGRLARVEMRRRDGEHLVTTVSALRRRHRRSSRYYLRKIHQFYEFSSLESCDVVLLESCVGLVVPQAQRMPVSGPVSGLRSRGPRLPPKSATHERGTFFSRPSPCSPARLTARLTQQDFRSPSLTSASLRFNRSLPTHLTKDAASGNASGDGTVPRVASTFRRAPHRSASASARPLDTCKGITA